MIKCELKTKTQVNETKTISQEIKLITPELAAEYLSRNVRNRKIAKATVDSYSEQMKRGEWQLTPQGISFNEYNELIDGQHRLSAVIQSNVSIEMFVFYNVPDRAFKVFDTGSKRQAAHVFQMEGIKNYMEVASGLKRFLIISETNQNTIGKVKGSSKISSSLLLEKYYDYKTLVDDVAQKATELYSNAALYSKSEIIGVYLHLNLNKKHSISYIDSFFNQLFTGRLINSPSIEKLRAKLIQSALLRSHKLTSRSKFIYLKKTWNAYTEKKDIKYLNYEIQNGQTLDFN